MPDMLVKLYDLPPLEPAISAQRDSGVNIRRGMPPEKALVLPWIRERFSEYWVSESDVAFSKSPPTIWLAHRKDDVLGFACYDTTHKNFFGPTGVDEAERGQGHWQGAAAGGFACHARGRLHVRHHRLGGSIQVLRGKRSTPWSSRMRSRREGYLGMLGAHAVFHEGAPSGSYLD